MLTIRPQPRSCIPGITAAISSSGASTSVRCASSHSSRGWAQRVGPRRRPAGVRDEDVDRPERRRHLGDQRRDVVEVRVVVDERRRADLGGDRREALGRSRRRSRPAPPRRPARSRPRDRGPSRRRARARRAPRCPDPSGAPGRAPARRGPGAPHGEQRDRDDVAQPVQAGRDEGDARQPRDDRPDERPRQRQRQDPGGGHASTRAMPPVPRSSPNA